MVIYALFIALVSVVKMKYCVKDTQIQWDAKLLTFVFQKVLRRKETISEENVPAIAPRFVPHMKYCALAKLIVTAACLKRYAERKPKTPMVYSVQMTPPRMNAQSNVTKTKERFYAPHTKI